MLLSLRQPNRGDEALSIRTLRGHGFADGGGDFAGEELDLAHPVFGGPVDEGIHPEIQGEARQLLDPLRGGAAQGAFACLPDPARDVVEALYLSRLAFRFRSGLVY